MTNGLNQIAAQTNKYSTRGSRNNQKKDLGAPYNSIFNHEDLLISKHGGNGGLTASNTVGLPNQDSRNLN
jgi:hypothetical protein